MTKKLLSERIDEQDYISTGPDDINGLENDVADLLGIAVGQLYNDSPFSFDEDGNITSAREGDSAQVVFTGTQGVVGLRLWDTTSDQEVLLSMNSDEFVIYENRTVASGGSGVLGGTANWKKRLRVSLHGGAVDGPGQDILNHLRMPTGFQGEKLKYLRVNYDEDSFELAAFDAATPDSCGIHGSIDILSCLGYGTWRNVSTNDDSVHVVKDWDNADMLSNVATNAYDYIEIQTAGIYSIVMGTSILQNQAGASNGYRGVGYNFVSDDEVNKSERNMAFDFLAATHQVFSGSWVVKLAANDKLYPKMNQTNTSAHTLNMYFRMAVTKISQES
ncbi:hypothetical protein DRQ25_18150 [Candidatus Fermentibacteria bacterium]|nr:MAG: hypothetical protein DRQ25_18150 [Candidatus Fermentibacteria bacterium]